jgi:hypothetical protein
MADFERLVQTNQLKTNILTELAKGKRPRRPSYKYERLFDAFIILVVPPEQETVVHYIDDHVGLLYQADDFEIVGMQVEAFEHSFVPKHENVQRVWRLSDSGVRLEDLGDIVLAVERLQPRLAQEVIKAAEDVLGEPGAELAAALT